MIGKLVRKARQVRDDPVLRRWLLARATGQTSRAARVRQAIPAYLDGQTALSVTDVVRPADLSVVMPAEPSSALDLSLPGAGVRLEPGEAPALFTRNFTDTETLLAVHRFAWLPLMTPDIDPAWVAALWRAWLAKFETPSHSWPWHPYTAAERAINIIHYCRKVGYPGDPEEMASVLACHATAIMERLEYFGDAYTSNHLANNGRGLYYLGLFLNWPACISAGKTILLHEAKRIFTETGMLREGSSHYHLLLTRNYIDAWLAACRYGRSEAQAFRSVAERALGGARLFALPGGFPLVGDISPDCPPVFLTGLTGLTEGTAGWLAAQDEDDRRKIEALWAALPPLTLDRYLADGWLRFSDGAWAGLWHCAPDGWSAMPGHGHQDCGGFELHYKDEPVFIDLGRGAYGDKGDAAYYCDAAAHNGLRINGQDPYPPNRPYYDPAFRRRIAGPRPTFKRRDDGVELVHHGYTRVGVGKVRRIWAFADQRLTISDQVEGGGCATVERRLHTSLPVARDGDRVVLQGRRARYVIDLNAPTEFQPTTRWQAYGDGKPATAIICTQNVALPNVRRLTVEVC